MTKMTKCELQKRLGDMLCGAVGGGGYGDDKSQYLSEILKYDDLLRWIQAINDQFLEDCKKIELINLTDMQTLGDATNLVWKLLGEDK